MSVFTYPVEGLRRVLIPQKCGWTLAWDSRLRWNGRVVIDSNDYPAKIWTACLSGSRWPGSCPLSGTR